MSIVVTDLPEVGITVLSRWIFNCYVVHDGGGGRPLVVDPGLPSTTAAALALLGSRRAGAVVAATHGHADHVGGLPVLRPHHPEVALPVRVRSYRAGERPRSPTLRAASRIAPVLGDQPRSVRSVWELLRCAGTVGYGGRGCHFPDEPDHWLADGDQVPGAPDWQVLQTPGHTDDSTSLWNRDQGVLLSGDAVIAVGGRAWFTPELVDPTSAATTEDHLRRLPVRYLLPGHGRPVVGTDVMRHALGPGERPPRAGRRR